MMAHIGDMNQAAYFAADDIHFVTREKQIVRAFESSSQASRHTNGTISLREPRQKNERIYETCPSRAPLRENCGHY